MGLFKWLADKSTSEKSEKEKLLLDLREGIKWLGKGYRLLAFRLSGSIRRKLKVYLYNSISWLEEAKKRTQLLISLLEKKNAPTYRKTSSFTSNDANLLALLMKLEKQLMKDIQFLVHARENIHISPLEIPPPNRIPDDYPWPVHLYDLRKNYKSFVKEIKRYK